MPHHFWSSFRWAEDLSCNKNCWEFLQDQYLRLPSQQLLFWCPWICWNSSSCLINDNFISFLRQYQGPGFMESEQSAVGHHATKSFTASVILCWNGNSISKPKLNENAPFYTLEILLLEMSEKCVNDALQWGALYPCCGSRHKDVTTVMLLHCPKFVTFISWPDCAHFQLLGCSKQPQGDSLLHGARLPCGSFYCDALWKFQWIHRVTKN